MGFLASFHLTGALAEKSCARVSFFHHFVAFCLGLWAHWSYSDRVAEDASFGLNSDFPAAVVLQHFGIGYFLYDTVHVSVWEQRFLVHHLVAIAGFGTSELGNVFALANAVNTWITESGSLMYSLYLQVRSDQAYILFVVGYTVSRAYFAVWSITVLRQVWKALQSTDNVAYAAWCPYCAATLQVMLLVINSFFLATHLQKAWKRFFAKAKD